MKVCFMDGWINRVKTLSLELNQRESESSIYSDLVVGRTSEAIEFQMVWDLSDYINKLMINLYDSLWKG